MRHQEIESVMEKLSSMLLSSSKQEQLGLSHSQISLIQKLFGDIATLGYKERIRILEKQLEGRKVTEHSQLDIL